MNRLRLTLALAIVTLIAVALSSCASISNSVDDRPQLVRDAGRCLQAGPCTVVQVHNQNFYEAAIYLNGAKVGEVLGDHDQVIFVRDSQLIDGRCATVSVRLIATRDVRGSTKECVPPGGRYVLDIDERSLVSPLRVWLTPRGGER